MRMYICVRMIENADILQSILSPISKLTLSYESKKKACFSSSQVQIRGNGISARCRLVYEAIALIIDVSPQSMDKIETVLNDLIFKMN